MKNHLTGEREAISTPCSFTLTDQQQKNTLKKQGTSATSLGQNTKLKKSLLMSNKRATFEINQAENIMTKGNPLQSQMNKFWQVFKGAQTVAMVIFKALHNGEQAPNHINDIIETIDSL